MTRYDALWLAGIVIVGVGLFAAICFKRLRGVPGNLVRRLLLAIAAFVLHGTIGVAFLIYLYPVLSHTPAAGGGLVIAMIGWLGLGARILFRLLPSEFWPEARPKPQWMQRFGIFDVACLFAVVGGAAILSGNLLNH
jgi:hypothetical protein